MFACVRFGMYKYAELLFLNCLASWVLLLAETWEAHLGLWVSWEFVFQRPGSFTLDYCLRGCSQDLGV